MDDQAKTLKLLAIEPDDAGGLSRKLGIPRNALFSLLAKMEKENLIVWTGRKWALADSSEPKRRGDSDARPPAEGNSHA